ncbi:MAG: DUF296 domain-containing protein [Lewinella sp.]
MPNTISAVTSRIVLKWAVLLLSVVIFSCQPSTHSMSDQANRVHPFRLLPGQDLRESIQQYADEHQIEAGYIITCVGSLTDWHLRFANQPDGTSGTGHFEIVSLVGTVSTHGSHLHLSLADSTGHMVGGHLLEGNIVYTTAEIVIGESPDHRFLREDDGRTGYRELSIKPRQ